LFNLVSAEILINEVMYDPIFSDSYNEWVEIYNGGNEEIDLNGWSVCGSLLSSGYINHSNGGLYLNITTVLGPDNYAIITDGGTGTEVYNNSNISSNVLALHVNTTGICGSSLNNNGDNITLNDNSNNLVDFVFYEDIASEGKSIEKYEYEWYESLAEGGTPGYENSVIYAFEADFDVLQINEFLPNPPGDDNSPMPNGEWIEIYNSGNVDLDLEGLKLKDNANHEIIISDVRTLSGTVIEAKGYLVVYMNGFSGFLNNGGLEIINLYNIENNLIESVSYDGSNESLSWSRVNGIWQPRIPSPGFENYYEAPDYNSDLEIETIYLGSDDKAKFGDNLRVKVRVYKGDTSKDSIQLYAKDENGDEISKRSKFNAYSAFTNYSLTIPIQLFPNCNGNFPEGDYIMYLTGLDETDEITFEVGDITTSLCETVTVGSTSYRDYHFEFLNIPYEIFQNFLATLKIVNNASSSTKFEVWSYIYRGSKSYSGDREGNKREVEVPWEGSINVNLENYLDSDVETGEYKLKIKIQKEDRVTPDEFTYDVYVIGSEEGYLEEFPHFLSKGLDGLSEATGNVIYSSSDIKAKELGVYFFCAVLIVLVIYLIIVKFL